MQNTSTARGAVTDGPVGTYRTRQRDETVLSFVFSRHPQHKPQQLAGFDPMHVMFGISNCSTVKKARAWLQKNGVAYRFHDYHKDGLTEAMLELFISHLGFEPMLNRSGMTWRKLPESARDMLDQNRALLLMLAHPAVIKRPLLELDGGDKFHLGFNEAAYKKLFTSQE